MQRSKLVIVLGVVVAFFAAGLVSLSGPTDPVRAGGSGIEQLQGEGPLDGMTFVGELGPYGEPKDIVDKFVFANGAFVSKECELRCKFPARPYFVRKKGSATEFVSETKCPYKDATIIWRGTIEGATITGVSTWTVKRWYWTIENRFEFSGKLLDQPTPVASAQ